MILPKKLLRAAAPSRPNLAGARGIGLDFRDLTEALPDAGKQVLLEIASGRGQRIESPEALLPCEDQSSSSQIRQVSRHARLGHLQNLDQVSDTHLSILKEIQDAQSVPVGEGPEHEIHTLGCCCLFHIR
jgi:hypothetical protein